MRQSPDLPNQGLLNETKGLPGFTRKDHPLVNGDGYFCQDKGIPLQKTNIPMKNHLFVRGDIHHQLIVFHCYVNFQWCNMSYWHSTSPPYLLQQRGLTTILIKRCTWWFMFGRWSSLYRISPSLKTCFFHIKPKTSKTIHVCIRKETKKLKPSKLMLPTYTCK